LAKCVWALEREEVVENIGTIQEKDARGWLMELFSILPGDDGTQVTVTM